MTDYIVPENTFWSDFSIAEMFGEREIRGTYKRAFAAWKKDYKMLTALVMCLNHKIWQHHKLGNSIYAKVYDELWKKADEYACDNLKGEEAIYFFTVTD